MSFCGIGRILQENPAPDYAGTWSNCPTAADGFLRNCILSIPTHQAYSTDPNGKPNESLAVRAVAEGAFLIAHARLLTGIKFLFGCGRWLLSSLGGLDARCMHPKKADGDGAVGLSEIFCGTPQKSFFVSVSYLGQGYKSHSPNCFCFLAAYSPFLEYGPNTHWHHQPGKLVLRYWCK